LIPKTHSVIHSPFSEDSFLLINETPLFPSDADFNQISSVLAKCRQNIHGLRDSSEELIPLFLNKIVQLTV